MKAQKIPKTDSIQALANFWDIHDLTDFEEQLEEVTEPVFERKTDTKLSIHLASQEAETVKRIAKTKGIDQEALIREWVVEKLHEEEQIGTGL